MAEYQLKKNPELAGNNREEIKDSLVNLLENGLASMNRFHAWIRKSRGEEVTYFGRKVENPRDSFREINLHFNNLLLIANRTGYFTEREISDYSKRRNETHNKIYQELDRTSSESENCEAST